MNIFEIFLMVILFYAHLSTDLHRFFFDNIRYFSEYFRSLSTSNRWITKMQPDWAHARRPTYVFTLWRHYGKVFFVDRYNDHISESESIHFIQKITATHLNAIQFIIFIFSFVDMNQLMIFWQKLLIAPNFRSFIYEEMKRRLWNHSI